MSFILEFLLRNFRTNYDFRLRLSFADVLGWIYVEVYLCAAVGCG